MDSNKWVGAHVSAAGGVENAPLNAAKIKAQAFGLFTKNQRRWKAKPLSKENITGFKKNIKEKGYSYDRILPHASYLINLGHPKQEGLDKSRNALLDECQRCEQLGITMLNVHPGSHLDKIDPDECLNRIAESINWVHKKTEQVSVIIENTAGQGTSMGYNFEHLASIIDQVEDQSRVGYCIDTCHAFAAGYEMTKKNGYEKMMVEMERIVGLNYLKGLHLNDSKKELGSRVDRHDKIGEGLMGLEPFRFIMNDDRLNEIPMILETPNRKHWDEEIQLLYSLVES